MNENTLVAAASSKASGTAFTNPLSIQIAKGSEKAET